MVNLPGFKYDDPAGHQYDPRHARGMDQCFTCRAPKSAHLALIEENIGNATWTKIRVSLPDGTVLGVVDRMKGRGERGGWKWSRNGEFHWAGFFAESKREAIDWLIKDMGR